MSDNKFPVEVKFAVELAEKMKSECQVEASDGKSWTFLEKGSFDYCKGFIDGGADAWKGCPLRIVCGDYILYSEGE